MGERGGSEILLGETLKPADLIRFCRWAGLCFLPHAGNFQNSWNVDSVIESPMI